MAGSKWSNLNLKELVAGCRFRCEWVRACRQKECLVCIKQALWAAAAGWLGLNEVLRRDWQAWSIQPSRENNKMKIQKAPSWHMNDGPVLIKGRARALMCIIYLCQNYFLHRCPLSEHTKETQQLAHLFSGVLTSFSRTRQEILLLIPHFTDLRLHY